MRVLAVPEWYPWPDKPVQGSWVREQSRALARFSDIVVLACDAVGGRALGWRAFSVEDATEDGIRVLRVRYRSLRFRQLSFLFRLAGMLFSMLRLARGGWVPDLIHARVFSSGLPAAVLARLFGAPLVVSEHYTGFPRGTLTRWDRLMAKAAFTAADVVCPDSADLGRYLSGIAPRA